MSHPKDSAALVKWERNLAGALAKDPLSWDFHDVVIQVTVAEYNRCLQKTPGYLPLDWRLVKALCWVESGAYSPVWKKNPMQIGAFLADPGLSSILTSPQGQLILPSRYKQTLNMANVPVIPENNIQAGTGYLLERMAYFSRSRTLIKARSRSSETIQYGISGWRHFTPETIAQRYNGGGDGNYAGKLAFCWTAITGRKGSII